MDPDEGWQKVLPRVGGERLLSKAELEAHERQILREWEKSGGHWSGIGKHTPTHDFADAKKLHHRFKPADKELGHGGQGTVEKVHFVYNNRTICLARKFLRGNRNKTAQYLREEAHVMEKLDHEHIVKLVGSYCVKKTELFILLWPVAVCNLKELFGDLDALKHGADEDEMKTIRAHMEGLELSPNGLDRQGQGTPPLEYLRPLIGCIARAVAYCHEANIRHLDLKPSNILLGPGRVYLADFGIARDVHGKDHTMTVGDLGGTAQWKAPEIYNVDDEWSMKAADVYSLGLVLLNITTFLYGADLADFEEVVDLWRYPQRRAEMLQVYHGKLEAMALATQTVADARAPTFAPRHILDLTARMVSTDPSLRPTASQVDAELVELGGMEQIYHFSCCRKSSRYVMDRMSNRLRMVTEERDQLRAEKQAAIKRLEVLERRDETYEARIKNERNSMSEKLAHLQLQLDKERAERNMAEALAEELQRTNKRQPRVAPNIPRPIPGRATPTGPRAADCGLTMRTRRAPPPPTSSSPLPAPQPIRKPSLNTTLVSNPQSSYLSQAAASANKAVSPVPGPLRRVSMPRGTAGSPGPSMTGSNTPTLDSPGYALRSRGSGSRLPQPTHPATPIRSGTPTFRRDPSSTDSSMASSTHSGLSGHSKYTAEATSVEGTPDMRNSPLARPNRDDATTVAGLSNKTPSANGATIKPSLVLSSDHRGTSNVGLGVLNLENAARRKYSIAGSDRRPSVSLSVSSAGAPPSTASPVMSSSTLSSPRATYAVLDPQTGQMKVPPLPTAGSWADVVRRERRK